MRLAGKLGLRNATFHVHGELYGKTWWVRYSKSEYVVQGVEGEKGGQKEQVFCKNYVGWYIPAIISNYVVLPVGTTGCQA